MRRIIIEVSDETYDSVEQTAAVLVKSVEEIAADAVTKAYSPHEVEDVDDE